RVVRAQRSDRVEVVPDCRCECGESAVVHKGGFDRDVAQRRRGEAGAVRRVACGVLATEVLIRVRPVKDIVRHGRDELRYRDRVLLKVSEHLVRGAGNGVALTATGLSEEEE